jgi:hypothetical protein
LIQSFEALFHQASADLATFTAWYHLRQPLLSALDSLTTSTPLNDLHADHLAFTSLVSSFHAFQHRLETGTSAQLADFTRLVDGFKHLMEGDALIARRYPREVVERLADEGMRKEVLEIWGRGAAGEVDRVVVREEENKAGVEKVVRMEARIKELEA